MKNAVKIFVILIVMALLMPVIGCEQKSTLLTKSLDVEEITGEFKVLWGEKMGVPEKRFLFGPTKPLMNAKFVVTPFGDFSGYSVNGNTKSIVEMIMNKAEADLIFFDSRMLPLLIETDFLEPLDVYMDSVLFDLSEFQSELISSIQHASPSGKMYAMPYARNVYALFYNKDLFSVSNVPYPQEAMTWDEVVDLARQFQDKNVIGLDFSSYQQIASQLNIQIIDEENNRVSIESPELEQMYQMMTDAPFPLLEGETLYVEDGFRSFNKGKVAMIAGGLYEHGAGYGFKHSVGYFDGNGMALGDRINWDVVTYPVLDSGDPVAPLSTKFLVGIPSTSKQKEKAFRVMKYLLSNDIQMQNVKNGLATVLTLEGMQQQLGVDQVTFEGIHTQAFFPGYREGTLEQAFDTKNIFLYGEFYVMLRIKNEFMKAIRSEAEKHLKKIAEFRLQWKSENNSVSKVE